MRLIGRALYDPHLLGGLSNEDLVLRDEGVALLMVDREGFADSSVRDRTNGDRVFRRPL